MSSINPKNVLFIKKTRINTLNSLEFINFARKIKIENKNIMSVFEGKTLLITGGTGSFGNAVLNRFLRTDIGEIRIFSRDEKKQDDMRHDFQARMPEVANKIKFYMKIMKAPYLGRWRKS